MRRNWLPGWILCAVLCAVDANATPEWRLLETGLELGRFPVAEEGIGGDRTVTVLRADPLYWSLELLTSTDSPDERRRTASEWSGVHGLAAVINAGMFDVDYRTHVGYCRSGGRVNNPQIREYQSVVACAPREGVEPPFRIFDLDEPGVEIESISTRYDCVVQNLRLIKRPRENRWSQQPKRWSEAALGQDGQGRILFLFTRTAYSMHDLNEILLKLPLDLVCAQHLEGGPEAQLFVSSGEFELELIGSYETGFFESDDIRTATAIPVVFGLRRKE